MSSRKSPLDARWSIQEAEPAVEPVTLDQARNHLRLDPTGSPPSHPDDDLISSQIVAARKWAEHYTARYFVQRNVTIRGDYLWNELVLPVAPLVSVTSLKYVDPDGVEQTLSDYDVDPYSTPPVITIDELPNVKVQRNAVTIEAVVGYESDESPAGAEKVPEDVKRAMLLVIGDLYENREQTVINASVSIIETAERLLWMNRDLGL